MEDFTTYTENDGSGVLTETASKVTVSNARRDGGAYLYKDYGASFFDALNIDFEFQIGASTLAGSVAGTGLSVSTVGTMTAFGASDFGTYFNYESGLGYRGGLFRGNFAASSLTGYVLSADTTYYANISRAPGGDTITMSIFSNAARTTHVTGSPLSLSGFGTSTKYRYSYGWNRNFLGGSNEAWYGFVQNMNYKPFGLLNQVILIG